MSSFRSVNTLKLILAAIGLILLSCPLVATEENDEWPGTIVSSAIPKELSLPQGLDERFPEEFDWRRSIMERGVSTADESEFALQACSVLWKRHLQVETECRAKRLNSHGPEYAAKFDVMEKKWRALCDAECEDFAGPPGEYKGSGYKVEYPMFVAELIQERIKWLKVER